jgi:hypothetical protein
VRAAGSIALRCDADAGRTRLRTIRCEGLSRSSRAFAEPGGAVRIVLSTLGPGVLAGDRFSVDGSVAERASLIACGQMATPVFAGGGPSQTDAGWQVADGATLIVAGEPLLLEPGSSHAAGAAFAVDGSGCAISVDTFGLRGAARLSMRAQAVLDGRLVYRDAYDVTDDLDGAFGTVTMIAADARRRAAFAERALELNSPQAVRIGVGETAAAVVVRLHGARVWDVRAVAFAIARG